jgi:hypothetical protein
MIHVYLRGETKAAGCKGSLCLEDSRQRDSPAAKKLIVVFIVEPKLDVASEAMRRRTDSN